MNKSLLILIFFAPLLAFGQSKLKYNPGVDVSKAKHANYKADQQEHFLKESANSASSSQRVSGALVKLGESANPFTSAFGIRSAFQYLPELDMMSFTFRQNPSFYGGIGLSGWIRYSYSDDAGANWTLNNGLLWDTQDSTRENGRYPQGFIYNPAGNTDPDSAYQIFIGPTLTGTNGIWGGVGIGSLQIADAGGTATDMFTFVDSANSTRIDIPEGGTYANGKMWAVEAPTDLINGGFIDSLAIYEGVIQNGALNVTRSKIYFPTQNDDDPPSGMQMAFSPDGQTGFIVGLGRLDSATYPKRAVNLLYMKTTDGGVTWGQPQEFYFADDPVVLSSIGDSIFANIIASAQFEVDVVVDTFGNPHTIMNIEWRPDNDYGFTYVGQPSTIWHVYSSDGGTTWDMNRLGTTHLRYGQVGASGNGLSQENRPQVSRDVNGRYVMFGWFDTDTVIFNALTGVPECTGFNQGYCGNSHRTLYYRGYNVVKDVYSDSTQLLSASFSLMNFEYLSEIAITRSNGIEIPIVYQDLSSLTAVWPVAEHYYESGVLVTFEELGDSTTVGLEGSIDVSNIKVFPNPSNGQVTVSVSSFKETTVSLEVVNILGHKVQSAELRKLQLGINDFDLDLSNLNPGIYLVKIGSEGDFTTKKLIIE